MKVVTNKDAECLTTILNAIKENDGYCPCSLIHSPATKCMCEEFREQKTPGFCHCGLYEKVED